MKPTLQPRLGQQLTLTPQLRQAIRLLQLSAAELELEINAAVDSNPLLEHGEEQQSEEPSEAEPVGEAPSTTEAEPIDTEFDHEPDWFESGPGSRATPDMDGDEDPQTPAAPLGLHDHLTWQLRLSHLSPHDLNIGLTLIDAINDDGYLSESLDALQAALRPEIEADVGEIETVLHLIQHFDPVGAGARCLTECLGLQLNLLSIDTPSLELARRIAEKHLDALAKLGAERLGRQLDASPADMHAAIALLRSLDPKPGARFNLVPPEYISPDAIAFRQGGVWKVSLPPENQPRLAINRHYQNLIGRASRADDTYLRAQLQEARWLIKSLETRSDTLLRVARAIVRQQSGFLDHGPEAMRPLTLREVAEELGLHESTISRATTRKYLRTPRGTFEFKDFFGSGVATEHGGSASATAIQAILRKLIEAEDPRAPLSDARLADFLKSEGIPVARRTVAKYREAMNIPSSNERQRLG